MKRVAVLGGGPSGAIAAQTLAVAGIDAVLIDEKLAWEKPCGGGLTYKAYSQYPFLIDNDTPKRLVTETVLSAPRAGAATLKLDQPLVVYARRDLNAMLLDRAARAGVQIEQERVMSIDRAGDGWRLRTKHGAIEADYCIVATGARNPLREVGTKLGARDTMSALGYYVPSNQDRIDIQFLPRLEGYIWVFPRCGHLSVGICGKGATAQQLRSRLEIWMDERGMAWRGAAFYSHVLPALQTPSWQSNRVAGDGWMAVGDAAGLVDPITGEGIYYAIRSGDLAARTLISDPAPSERIAAYLKSLRKDFVHDLEFGSRLARHVFVGRFLFRSFPQRMVEFTRRSPRFAALMQDLFAGRQDYLGLKRRLFENLNGSLFEVAMSFGLSRVFPRAIQNP